MGDGHAAPRMCGGVRRGHRVGRNQGTPDLLDRLINIMRAPSVEQLQAHTSGIYQSMGLTRVMVVSSVGHNRMVGRDLANMGFPKGWSDAYRAGNYLNDPLPDIAVRIGGAFFWHELPDDVTLSSAESAYLESLESWGMGEGIGTVVYGSAASVAFVGAAPDGAFGDGPRPDRELFQIVAQMSFLRYCALNWQSLEYEMTLSNRELEVLHWMAQGKSNVAIAEILNVGQETVSTYVKRIFAKLEVFDRTSAVMRGVIRGLVIASDPEIDAAIRERQEIMLAKE